MSFETILVLVGDDGVSRIALKTAIAVGRKFNAYVEAMHVRVSPESVIPVVAEGLSGAAAVPLLEDTQARAEEKARVAHRLFQEVAVEESLPLTTVDADPAPGQFAVAWRDITGVESREIAERGRLFDLVVLAQPEGEHKGTAITTLEAALFDTGRPLLIAPAIAPTVVGERIMLAWADTRESARALWAGEPFLEQAKKITAVTITDDAQVGLENLSRILAHKGVSLKTKIVSGSRGTDGEQLLATAKDLKSDLLIMGAYGHSRLQEFILGGATKHVLQSAELPVLMAH